MKIAAAIVAISVACTACAPQAGAEAAPGKVAAPATHPVSGLAIIPLTVTTAKGPHRFMVEVADTPQAQEKGLMFRRDLGPDEGMIFPNDPPAIRSFWMKNTLIPLDIIFIGPRKRILNIRADAEPYSLDPLYSIGPAINVLEIPGGRAAVLGIKAGDAVAW